MDSPRSAQRALFVLLIASFVLVVWVLRPIAIGLFLAAVLAAALWPFHSWLSRVLRGSPRIAAALVVIGVVLLLVGPLVGISAFVVKSAAEGLRFVQDTLHSKGVDELITRLPASLESPVRNALNKLPLNTGEGASGTVQQQVGVASGRAAAAVGAIVSATGSLVFQTALMLIALYFFLTQKDEVLHFIDDASPLRPGQTRELLTETRTVSVAVLRSTILTAGVQAIAALVGYYIARVPYPLFFAVVTFFVAMIPAVGAASVCEVLAVLLGLSGHMVAAVFLGIWGLVVVGLSDNVVKPWLIKGGVQMHGAVVFFALLGGLAAFGTIGLLLGPLAVAFFVAVLRIYRRDYVGPKTPQHPQRPIEV